MRTKYKTPKIDYSIVRKSMTIPDQTMSIQEIVKRYTRGVPVDVIQRQGVYVDQNDHDLEAMSRMDFAEKAELAESLRRQNEGVVERIKESKREQRARERQEAKDAENVSQNKTGIDSLDNTMPVDTKLTKK